MVSRSVSFIALAGLIASTMAGCGPGTSSQPAPEKSEVGRAETAYGEFSIDADVIAAIQGGPVIVRVVFRYTGTADRVTVMCSRVGRDAEVIHPEGWAPRDQGGYIYSGPTTPKWELALGPTKTEYYPLHQLFGGIREGSHDLTLRWHVRLATDGKPEIAVPQKSVTVLVQPATDESIGKLREFIDHELARPDVAESFKPIALALDGTNEPRVLRLRFDLLDDPRLPEDCANINPAVRYRGLEPISAEEERNLVGAICDYLARPYPKYASHLVYWMTGKAAPRGFVDAIRPRFDGLHVLVRTAAGASFPDLLDGPQESKLLSELTARYGPPDSAVVETHVRQLDAVAYRDRESAAAALRKFGAPALGLLRAEAAKQRSAESRERLQGIIAAIEKADRPEDQPLEARVLKHLQGVKTKRADAMLGAIAAAASDAWIVREARAIRGKSR